MNWQPKDVILVLTAAAVLIFFLRYAKVIIRTLMVLGGLLFLAIAAIVVALAMGWWQPSLFGILEAVIQ